MADPHAEPDFPLVAPLLASRDDPSSGDVGKPNARRRNPPRSGAGLPVSTNARRPDSPLSTVGSEEDDAERVSSGDAASSPRAVPNGALAPGTLSFKAAVALCCADIIGSGIFASPGIVLRWTGSVGAALGAWTVAGLITYVGFACLAELSVLDPNAGGLFYYFRVAFGGAVAFSWTFINFAVIVPGSLGALALTFAHYLGSAIPGWEAGGFEETADVKVRGLACAAVAAAAALNCLSASHGGGFAKIFLAATLLGCAFVFALGIGGGAFGWRDEAFAVGATDTSNTTKSVAAENFDPRTLFKGTRNFSSVGVGLISALWSFAGAMDVASMGEELRDPERALPRVGVTGLAIVSLAYICLNIAYLLVLPAEVIANGATSSDDSDDASKRDGVAMGVTFARAVAGRWAGVVVTVVVAVSSFGALNSCLYLSARQFYATARDGLFPASLARTNARQAPHVAILAVAAWTVALTRLMSSFAALVNYLSCAMWLYYGLVGIAVFKSRASYPDADRPYEVPGYPVVPALYVSSCAYLSACTFAAAPRECLCALAFVAVAFPLHEAAFAWWPARRARLATARGREERLVSETDGDGSYGVANHEEMTPIDGRSRRARE
jgi:APA family basic amino acid/polyamine antiporter